ncbi:MAG: hypothetical protein HY730_05645 [Candidatus Tectomicrobia bacterium]|uniref:Uncharacterized protein n=1 Tax=Tectimicrobiota bacterium TaxID=2528274 RepID=A0A933GL29_UNCTE|nr:hypothetical protein [Candidatus Tectomicrobia bacterium]
MRCYLFLATEDGLLTFEGEKDRWQEIARGLEDHKATPVAARDGVVLAGSPSGLYRPDNGGKSWVRRYECYCRAIWSDPKDFDHVVLGPADSAETNGRIEESFNGGLT